MTSRALLISASFGLLTAVAAQAQLAPNAPQDKPVQVDSTAKIEAAIQPYVAQARANYPQARGRFLAGLPKGNIFFATTELRDAAGKVEMVFIGVQDIRNGRIYGRIASDINLVQGYRRGQLYDFSETELNDWTISKPDGTEEGNYVGKFLDTYQP